EELQKAALYGLTLLNENNALRNENLKLKTTLEENKILITNLTTDFEDLQVKLKKFQNENVTLFEVSNKKKIY
ncbi:hypothetical protein HK099_001696, partial [Clydaea vesicula]